MGDARHDPGQEAGEVSKQTTTVSYEKCKFEWLDCPLESVERPIAQSRKAPRTMAAMAERGAIESDPAPLVAPCEVAAEPGVVVAPPPWPPDEVAVAVDVAKDEGVDEDEDVAMRRPWLIVEMGWQLDEGAGG